jgi:hypothetical protein
VKCQQLSPLLARVGIRHINYWVLDVEGAELEILEVRPCDACTALQ